MVGLVHRFLCVSCPRAFGLVLTAELIQGDLQHLLKVPGLLGAGIAGAHVRRGVPVMLMDSNPYALEKGVGANVKVMQDRIRINRMTAEEMNPPCIYFY